MARIGSVAGRVGFAMGRIGSGDRPTPERPPGSPVPSEPPNPVEPPNPPGHSGARSTIPRFETVPEAAQFPQGPYRQAPAEFGGEWWLTNPFTGEEPWKTASSIDPYAPPLPPPTPSAEDLVFQSVFGLRPTRLPGMSTNELRTAIGNWELNREHFGGVGAPEGSSEEQLTLARDTYQEWGLGEPVYYQGRYGWKVRFPESANPAFEAAAAVGIQSPHLIVAKFQVRQIQAGETPAKLHAFVPPGAFPERLS